MFEYEVKIGDDTHTLVLKPMTELPVGILRRNRHDPEEQMWSSLEWGLQPEQFSILDQLASKELQHLMQSWQAYDGVTLGESDASSTSSTSTARRSKQTSSTKD